MALSFTHQLIAEQIRALEETQGAQTPPTVASSGLDFPSWLVLRNAELCRRDALRAAVHHAPVLFHRLLLGFSLLALLLGAVTSIKALGNAGTQLNIFWVLGVLLGLSWLSLLLWLVTLFLNRGQAGVLAPLFSKLLDRLLPQRREPSAKHAAGRIWLQRLFMSRSGFFRLGWLTHWFWGAYLIGGILGLLLLFGTRQFDFVWESTLFSGDAFVALTNTLAPPLAAIGVPVPDAAQVFASSLDRAPADAASTRRTWALFLLGCVLVYGLVPRLLAALICALGERHLRSRQQLDLNQPYYVRLQREFWPQGGRARILDADAHPSTPPTQVVASAQLPENCLWLGLELPEHFALPTQAGALGTNVRDDASQQHALELIRDNKGPIALLIDGNKSGDRGLQRVVMALVDAAGPSNLWLVLRPMPAQAKYQSWLQAAARAGLTAEQVTSL